MTAPKLKPCPECRTAEHLAIYTYDHGWKHVECDKCNYMGPGDGSKVHAIKSHNARFESLQSAPPRRIGRVRG